MLVQNHNSLIDHSSHFKSSSTTHKLSTELFTNGNVKFFTFSALLYYFEINVNFCSNLLLSLFCTDIVHYNQGCQTS